MTLEGAGLGMPAAALSGILLLTILAATLLLFASGRFSVFHGSD